jgi:hypothetical protein
MNEDNMFKGLESLVEVTLPDPQNFLKIAETLTRIGIASKKDKTLFQSCLPNNSEILTEDGIKTIKEIVDTKYTGKVLSINSNGDFEFNRVLAHHVKDNLDKKWVDVICSNLKSNKRLVCTDDHQIGIVEDCFNPEIKFIPAKDSLGKYLIKNPVKNSNAMFNITKIFNKDQIECLIGTILGDACITKHGNIQFNHCFIQKEYIEEKVNIFNGTNIKEFVNAGFGNKTNAIRASIDSNQQTKKLRTMLYINGKKTVKNIINMITEKSLAYWYMDDGNIVKVKNKNNDSYYCMLNTQGFSLEDHKLLVSMFKDKFNIDAKIDEYNMNYKNQKKTYFRLRLNMDSSKKLFNLVAPYINECMKYKLSPEYRNIEKIKINNTRIEYALQEIKEVKYISKDFNNKYLSSKLYDIEVENAHNFIANGSLVHNCHLLHKKGKYYVTHFKEMFGLDGHTITFDEDDLARRNTIANLLEDWGLLSIVDPAKTEEPVSLMNTIKVLSYKEKSEWKLVPKYQIGKKNYNKPPPTE